MSIIGLNSKTDPNKILPMTYKWAREHYKDGVANNWTPEEISMQKDVEQWKSDKAISDVERRMILWNLGFFSTAESLTANNIVLTVYKHVTNPESRQYLLRQAYEEAVHTDTFIYCCDTLGLDPDYIYSMYETIPSIKEKDDFVVGLTKSIMDPNFEIKTTEDINKHLLKVDGAMIGRAIYHSPYFLAEIEKEIFKNKEVPTRTEVMENLIPYIQEQTSKGIQLNHIMRHTVGLFHGQNGSRIWKQYLSKNMCIRDADLQKVNHIMDQVKKTNPVSLER